MNAHKMPTHHNSMGNNVWTITEGKFVEESIFVGYEDVINPIFVLPIPTPIYEIKRVWKSVTSDPFVF